MDNVIWLFYFKCPKHIVAPMHAILCISAYKLIALAICVSVYVYVFTVCYSLHNDYLAAV